MFSYDCESDSDDEVTVDVTIRHQTDKAILAYDGKREVWVPKSQIRDLKMGKAKTAQITIPEWLAKDKGLV